MFFNWKSKMPPFPELLDICGSGWVARLCEGLAWACIPNPELANIHSLSHSSGLETHQTPEGEQVCGIRDR